MNSIVPNLFIVGAGKAGTSALHTYLGQHPDIYMCPQKEPNQFGSDLKYRNPRPPLQDYLRLFSEGRGKSYRGESSVSYLLSQKAASEIKEVSPNAKIIIMVRNPIEIMYSRYAQNILVGDENASSFEKALKLEKLRKRGEKIPSGIKVVDWLYYTEWAKLTEQAQRYLNVFGPDNVFIGLFDDFQECPGNFFASVLEFLSLPYAAPRSFELVNTKKKVHSAKIQRLLKGRNSFVSLIGKHTLPSQRIRSRLRSTLTKMNVMESGVRPMDIKTRRYLEAILYEEIGNLEDLLGRDLKKWLVT